MIAVDLAEVEPPLRRRRVPGSTRARITRAPAGRSLDPGEQGAVLACLPIAGLGADHISYPVVQDAPLYCEVTVFTCPPEAYEEQLPLTYATTSAVTVMAKHDPPGVPHRTPMDLEPHLDPIPHVREFQLPSGTVVARPHHPLVRPC